MYVGDVYSGVVVEHRVDLLSLCLWAFVVSIPFVNCVNLFPAATSLTIDCHLLSWQACRHICTHYKCWGPSFYERASTRYMHAIPETESPESCFEKAPLQLCKFIENLQYYEDIAGIMLKWRHARSPIIMWPTCNNLGPTFIYIWLFYQGV